MISFLVCMRLGGGFFEFSVIQSGDLSKPKIGGGGAEETSVIYLFVILNSVALGLCEKEEG